MQVAYKLTRDLNGANGSHSASAVSGLQPEAARPYACVITKNSSLCLFLSNHRWHGRMLT